MLKPGSFPLEITLEKSWTLRHTSNPTLHFIGRRTRARSLVCTSGSGSNKSEMCSSKVSTSSQEPWTLDKGTTLRLRSWGRVRETWRILEPEGRGATSVFGSSRCPFCAFDLNFCFFPESACFLHSQWLVRKSDPGVLDKTLLMLRKRGIPGAAELKSLIAILLRVG